MQKSFKCGSKLCVQVVMSSHNMQISVTYQGGEPLTYRYICYIQELTHIQKYPSHAEPTHVQMSATCEGGEPLTYRNIHRMQSSLTHRPLTYRNICHMQSSLMCGSQLCVEVGIPWRTEISLMCRFHLYIYIYIYQLQVVRATYVVYRWILVTFMEGGGQICTYTLAQLQ